MTIAYENSAGDPGTEPPRSRTAGALVWAAAVGSDPVQARPARPFPMTGILSDLASRSPGLMNLLYGHRILGFYALLFGEPVKHFDFTWLRAIPPGPGTKPHGDSVFMNRGTSRLLTAWTPLGDVDVIAGGLTVLEGSHHCEDIRREYGSRDVDTYCVGAEAAAPRWEGYISEDPQRLRAQLGLRWLTGDYAAGDVITFTP